MEYRDRVWACLHCDRREKAGSAVRCGIDGADLDTHGRADYCPHPDGPRYGTGDKPDGWDQLPKAGDPGEPFRFDVPREKWPRVIRVIAKRKIDGERGVGDTAKRILHRMGANGLAWLYEKATGKDCGCGDRRERLNMLFPYT